MVGLVELEMQKRGLEEKIELSDKLDRLFRNPDFQDVIQKEFCENEVLAYLAISTDVNLPDDARAEGLDFARAGVILKRWLQLQGQLIDRSRNELENVKEHIEFARQEGN